MKNKFFTLRVCVASSTDSGHWSLIFTRDMRPDMENMAVMFENMDRMLKKLKKSSYEKNTAEFVERHGGLVREIIEEVEQSETKADTANEISRQLTGDIKRAFANRRGKIPAATQANLNLFMIFYVFPTILKTESEDMILIADTICEQWNKDFKGNNIRYTDYDTLYGSFREKIFGLF